MIHIEIKKEYAFYTCLPLPFDRPISLKKSIYFYLVTNHGLLGTKKTMNVISRQYFEKKRKSEFLKENTVILLQLYCYPVSWHFRMQVILYFHIILKRNTNQYPPSEDFLKDIHTSNPETISFIIRNYKSIKT